MSSYKIGEDLKTVDTVAGRRWGCAIKLHRLPFFASDAQIVQVWDNYPFEQYMKWRWYFRYRAALLQVQFPRQAVELNEFQWSLTKEECEKIRYRNKLIAAKATLTKDQNKVAKFIANWNLLFPYQDEPNYQAALAKIERTKKKIEELEAINASLNKNL